MKRLLMLTAATLIGTAAAQAQSAIDIDTDLDGTVSLAEAQAADPAVTQTDFDLYDLDANGELSATEYAAWNEDRTSATIDAEIDTDASVVTEDEAITTESEVSTDADAPLDPTPVEDGMTGENSPQPDLDIESDIDLDIEPVAPELEADPEPVLEPDLTTDPDPAIEIETDIETGNEDDDDPQ
ncbi:hypothetical protein [Hyphobacterium marinum]|uniref:EF-hand domain-containing protein n=1 Tax=Hyphobacterium marinum TaxID=3116574 RepID=A0ABU7LUQ7_9PROT|nr:hypothetical protein [Hyphobacterium sp. Y6023]MEE2565294.1 hypothetical protein [Hyphobacterium sp. Y6023]